MDILSYILSKKNNGSSTGGSGGTGGSGSSNASVFVKGGGTVVDPAQIYSRLYFNTKLSNEEVMALMNNLELNWQGSMNMLYVTDQFDMIAATVVAEADYSAYALASESSGYLFAINGKVIDEGIAFTGWNPDIDFSNGIEIIGNTTITEIPTDQGPMLIGANNDKIADLFSSEPFKKSVNKGLSGVYDGNNIEVGSTHIDVSSLLDENKLPLNIDVVDNNLIPRNIVEGVNILGVEGTYSAHGLENEFVDRTLTTYTNNRVTSVGEYAFYNHKNLTIANFSNVTNIGQYAFCNCASLTSINFSNATNIGDSAFSKCFKLTSIDFPKATDIRPYAFQTCTSLTDIDFPEATSIGEHAFQDCSLLTNVNFPKVTHIYLSAFTSCSKLTSINFSNVANIGDSAFNGCKSLTTADFPRATIIEQYAFYACSGLTNINLPEAIDIGSYAFANCSGLTEINLPKATDIRVAAFNSCSNLTNVDFPEASDLKPEAFMACHDLISVRLPKVTSIGNSAFSYCYPLNKLFIAQAEQICTLGQAVFKNCYHILGTTNSKYNPNGLKDGYIYVPASLLSQYKVATNWSEYATQIIGHEDLEAGATLPNYTTDTFTTQTWYSDEKLTTVVTEVATTGKYYCRLEA